jgi:hypothetical protein
MFISCFPRSLDRGSLEQAERDDCDLWQVRDLSALKPVEMYGKSAQKR